VVAGIGLFLSLENAESALFSVMGWGWNPDPGASCW
jgi:hypothetical protein